MTDEKEIKLDPDNQAVLLRTIREMQMAWQTLGKAFESDGEVSEDLARNILSVTEYNTSDIGKKLGIKTETEEMITQRHANLRAANLRVRDLEAQLGASVTPTAVQTSLGVLEERIHDWWKLKGFGHVSEESFGRYGCKVKLSCHLFGDFSLIQSETPISDKERWALWIEHIKSQGFLLGEDSREPLLIDCDHNRKVLIDLISHDLPSSKVISFGNHSYKGGFKLQDVNIYIYKLEDILELPQKPKSVD